MLNKITLSKRAFQQSRDIYWSTAEEHGYIQADKYTDGLEHTLGLLAENPSMGRSCDYIKSGYMRFEYGSHVIFYRKRKNDIFIIQIIHYRMDVKRHL